MAQVSRKYLGEKIRKRILEVFLATLADLKNVDDARAFFNAILTDTEQTMLAKRLAIAFLLEKNYDFRSIEKLLKVSTATIGAVHNKKKFMPEAFGRTISKFLAREAKENISDELEIGLADFGSIISGWRKKNIARAAGNVHQRRREAREFFSSGGIQNTNDN